MINLLTEEDIINYFEQEINKYFRSVVSAIVYSPYEITWSVFLSIVDIVKQKYGRDYIVELAIIRYDINRLINKQWQADKLLLVSEHFNRYFSQL